MEFFNKKQDVIKVELTGYGKNLLSKGVFKPVYYAYSDDGVLYDAAWVSGSNSDAEQSYTEQRIQEETPRMKVQSRKIGAEKSVFLPFTNTISNALLQQLGGLIEEQVSPFISIQEYIQLIEKTNATFDQIESEKLLENMLGTKSFSNSYNPSWNALFFHGDLDSSSPNYKKNNTTYINIPQLNCNFKEIGYRVSSKYDPYEVLSHPKNVVDGLKNKNKKDKYYSVDTGAFFEEVPVSGYTLADIAKSEIGEKIGPDPGVLFVQKDFIFLSLEEANVDFTKDNFMIEVFEVTTVSTDGDEEEKLVKMAFKDNADSVEPGMLIGDVFDIEVDEEIEADLACYLIGKDQSLKQQSIYISNIFDCDEIEDQQGAFVNPYDNLPEITTGDTC